MRKNKSLVGFIIKMGWPSNKSRSLAFAVLMTTGLLLFSGCSNVHRQAMIFDEVAFARFIEPIILMPIIDTRTDKSVSFEETDSQQLLNIVINKLQKIGYSVELAPWNTFSENSGIQLSGLNIEELCDYVPHGTRTALIISVNSLHDSYKVFQTSFSITGTASLICISDKKVIWKDAAVGQQQGGGPGELAVVVAGIAQIGKRGGSYEVLVNNLFASFPPKQI
ncbi:MAG: hypothetical protein SWQ30_22380 [Thermodesulfobacteriota bacterium]|nr:hypothetical protein [Thermodesulfobacteriota bacterium]